MLENLGGVTSQIVRLALDVSALRHQITAHNIANASTPGFVPKRVEFGDELRALVDDVAAGNESSRTQARIARLDTELASGAAVEEHADQVVEVDAEVVDLADNVLRYRALLESLAKRGELLRSAIRERGM